MPDTQSLCIAPATPADAPLILQFIKELADYERLAREVDATEEGLRQALFCPHPRVEAMIARWDNQPAGFAVFFENFSTFRGRHGLYLEDLFVRPAFRGRSIGKALLKHLAEIAADRGCPRVEWSVLDWNESAIEFYKRLGAVPMSDWTVFRLTGDALRKLASG